MTEVQFSLRGVDDLISRLKTIDNDVKRKSGRFALRKAANIVAQALKSGAQRLDDPETGRSISQNVAVRFSPRRFKRTGDLMFRVGILQGAVLSRGGNKSAGAPTPHWRLLEFGTERMAAQPFARSALEENIGPATNEFVVQFRKALDRAARRAIKGKAS